MGVVAHNHGHATRSDRVVDSSARRGVASEVQAILGLQQLGGISE